MSDDTMDPTEKVLSKVAMYPELYDRTHADAKNHFKRDQIWEDIARESGMSSDQAKKRYKTARDVYVRSMKLKKDRPDRWRQCKHHTYMAQIVGKSLPKSLIRGSAPRSAPPKPVAARRVPDERTWVKSNPFNIKLLKAIQCRPVLYNREVLHPNVRMDIWQEIADNLDAEGER